MIGWLENTNLRLPNVYQLQVGFLPSTFLVHFTPVTHLKGTYFTPFITIGSGLTLGFLEPAGISSSTMRICLSRWKPKSWREKPPKGCTKPCKEWDFDEPTLTLANSWHLNLADFFWGDSVRILQPSFRVMLLLMVQKSVDHQLRLGSLSYSLQGFVHPRWCRISEPSTVAPENEWLPDEFSFWFSSFFLGRAVSFRECTLPENSQI